MCVGGDPVITMREYAQNHNVSYEAIRKQTARFRKELEGHVTTKGQTYYLDDFAVSFLDDRRRGNPVVLYNQDQRDEVQLLRDQVEALRNELMTTQKRVIDLQTEKQILLEAKVKYDLLVESNAEKQTMIDTLREDLTDARKNSDQLREDLQSAKTDADRMRDELRAARADADQVRKERDAAQADAGSYRKSIFGFYRKKRS